MKQLCAYSIVILIICYGFYGLIHCASRLPLQKKSFQQKLLCKYVPHKKGEPLRILFVVDSFPHFDQPFILDQIVGVIDHGHEVYIAAKTEVKNSIMPDVVYRYDLMERTLFFGKSNPFKLLKNHSKIPHINTFDVICCQFGSIGADAIRFKYEAGSDILAKVVTCWRGALKEATMQPYVYAALFKRGDLFIPVCEFLKRDLIELGCNENKIRVLYVGINYDSYVCERVKQPNSTIELMSICRLVEKKGIEYAIRAVESVVKTYPHVHYTIIGDGPLKKELESLVTQLQMQDHIEFMGNQPHEKIPDLLRKADIFLSPSVTTPDGNQEGIANSLKEAIASGALVIATDHAGTQELVHDGVSGFLVPERDVVALEQKICYLIAHPEIWEVMRIFGRQIVHEQFCLSKSINQFIAIVEEVCIH